MIVTASQLLEHYLSRKVLAPITVKNYRKIVVRFESVTTPMIELINEDVCLAWKNRVLEETSIETYNSYLRCLRALFSYGYARGIVPDNPFKQIEFQPNHHRRPKGVTDEGYRAAIRYLESPDGLAPGWFWALLVKFMACTGVRARQVVNLQWRDLDFENMIAHLRVSGSKTRREWEIPLSLSLAEPLRDLHKRSGLNGLRRVTPEDQVFNVTLFYERYWGSVMTVSQVTGFYRRLSEAIGHKISSRRLRHSLATRLANVGSPDLFAIQELLGHTDIRTTRRYVRTDVERIRLLLSQAGVM